MEKPRRIDRNPAKAVAVLLVVEIIVVVVAVFIWNGRDARPDIASPAQHVTCPLCGQEAALQEMAIRQDAAGPVAALADYRCQAQHVLLLERKIGTTEWVLQYAKPVANN